MIEVFNMTEIFIKYNRFLDEMLCTIDGEGLKNSSNLNYQGNCASIPNMNFVFEAIYLPYDL